MADLAGRDAPPSFRLDDRVVPISAELTIDIDPGEVMVEGRAVYQIDIRSPGAVVWMHGRDLLIEQAVLELAGTRIELERLPPPLHDPDLLGLAAARPFPAGLARLTIDYRARQGDSVGLFRQAYNRKWYSFSDFEPTDARSAFPAFDDPRFKHPWQVTLQVPADLKAFSNTPVVTDRTSGDVRTVSFAPTPPLPTYLVAIAVGPFEVVSDPAADPRIRVLTQEGLAAHAEMAVRDAAALLAIAERYMGQDMPFAKLDFVSVPTFNGAMENPGLVTVSKTILLREPERPDSEARREAIDKMRIVLAHEIAHLWFGDVVTMGHWDELWLNEGLATWMSDRLLGLFDARYRGRILDLIDKSNAIADDMDTDPVPVRQAVGPGRDPGEMFTTATYRKGGAILAMFESFVGAKAMQKALRGYVTEHAFGTVTQRDLARALSAQADRDLGPALDSFVDQTGIPIVLTELDCPADSAPNVVLEQVPFSAVGSSPAKAIWQIPMCITTSRGDRACTLLGKQPTTLELGAGECPSWVHPNPGEHGYYLYGLSGDMFEALARSDLDQRERVGLVLSIGALLASGRIALADALDALLAVAEARDPYADLYAVSIWHQLVRSIIGHSTRPGLARRLAVYLSAARQVGNQLRPGDGKVSRALRGQLVELVARYGGHPELRRPGDVEMIDQVVARVEAGEIPDAQLPGTFRALLADPDLTERILPLAVEHFPRLVGSGIAKIDHITMFGPVCRTDQRQQVARLIARLENESSEKPLPLAAETLDFIDQCIAFRRRYLDEASSYFR